MHAVVVLLVFILRVQYKTLNVCVACSLIFWLTCRVQDRSELGIHDFATSAESSDAVLANGGKKDKDKEKSSKKGKQSKAKKEAKGEEEDGEEEDSKEKSGSELVASRPENVRYDT